MKYFVAYMVEGVPYYWLDVNTTLVKHTRIESGECEPLCFDSNKAAHARMQRVAAKVRFFFDGEFKSISEKHLPAGYGDEVSLEIAERSVNLGYAREAKEKEDRAARNHKRAEDMKDSRAYVIMTGARYLGDSDGWITSKQLKEGALFKVFSSKVGAERKAKEIKAVYCGKHPVTIRNYRELIKDVPEAKGPGAVIVRERNR